MDITAPGCQVHHTRNLLSLLFSVSPEVADDPNLVERSVLLTVVTTHTSPRDLLYLFPRLRTDAAVVVRDYETGERAGLVVLASDLDCDEAIKLRPPRLRGRVIYYRACIKARAWQEQAVLADAADDHARRRPTAEVLHALVPPVYVEEDEDSSIHLRCVFLRGAYSLSHLDETLPAKGSVCAIVTCKAKSVAVLVYDDADSAEDVARSLVRSRVQMYDSSVFPFAAGAGAGAAAAELRGMIPASFTHPEYLGRMVLFRGLDTEHCDARHVAGSIQSGLESLIVHRHQGLVIAVFGSTQDARLQLHETAENWVSIFGRPLTCELLCDPELFMARELELPAQDEEPELFAEQAEELLVAPKEGPHPGVHCKAIERVQGLIQKEMRSCAPGDTKRIAKLLMKLSVLSRPDAIRHKIFPDRALLLLGIRPSTSISHLRAAMSKYGELDDLCLCDGTNAALVVFRAWVAAFMLLQQPAETWLSIGFLECREVPGVEHAAQIADQVCTQLSEFDAMLKMAQLARCETD